MIAWVSTCLLAGGVSTLFNDNSRVLWLFSGSFGLAAAVGLDIAARSRERLRMENLELIATSRIERDIRYENEENIANSAIRKAVAQLLGRLPLAHHDALLRRNKERYPCDLDVELVLYQDKQGTESAQGTRRCNAHITNLSEFGFELLHSERLPRQRMQMIIWSAKRVQETMLGEILWCNPRPNGSFIAGGRFLDVIPDDDQSAATRIGQVAVQRDRRD
jgi:hypothetical protein